MASAMVSYIKMDVKPSDDKCETYLIRVESEIIVRKKETILLCGKPESSETHMKWSKDRKSKSMTVSYLIAYVVPFEVKLEHKLIRC